MGQKPQSTRQKILEEALTLFSVKGFNSVSVFEIADAVGIKAPSLYKHYKSKQDILEAILNEMDIRYENKAAAMQMHGTDAGMDKKFFEKIDEEKLVAIGKDIFQYFLHDEFTDKFRKMLTIEQFNNKDLSTLYTERFIDAPLIYQKMLFGMLTQAGIFVSGNYDVDVVALHFYSPIFLLLSLCGGNSEREEEAVQLLERHIRQFNRIYRKEK